MACMYIQVVSHNSGQTSAATMNQAEERGATLVTAKGSFNAIHNSFDNLVDN